MFTVEIHDGEALVFMGGRYCGMLVAACDVEFHVIVHREWIIEGDSAVKHNCLKNSVFYLEGILKAYWKVLASLA